MSGALGVIATLVLFIVVLGSLVLIHELGHFVTARLAGIRVLEFGVGFPPRAKVLRSSGDTLYTLNWLPIGGFVKLEGEDGDDTDDPRSFANASLAKRIVILLAGVAMNLFLAFAIFTAIAWLATPYVGLRFFDVQPGSPASSAGLTAGDAILAIDGQQYPFLDQGDVLTDLRSHVGDRVTLTIEHADGTVAPVVVQLRSQAEIDASKDAEGNPTLGPLGVSGEKTPFESRLFGTVPRDLPTAIGIGVEQTGHWFGVIVDGLASLVRQVATNPTAAPPVSGPIGIATTISDIFFGAGPVMTIYVAGILSANLALVNVLPFPPLDGGRILMLVLKRLLGARLSLRAEQMTYVVGFAFLFAFLIWVSGFDIVRILSGGT
ncbi:MAG TPA: M50 family metallopeptidase [Candidatus Limnocylindrales bacterium]|nr:M50 family metallopeptidase [Candidatus Limnocylindrales bacterium]